MSPPKYAILILLTGALSAQDFTLNIPTFDHDYVVPVDTLSRRLYIGQEFMEWDWPGGLWHLEFTFDNAGPRPVVYTFAGLVQGSSDFNAIDTVDFQVMSVSTLDSLRTGQFLTPNGMANGFQYVDMPGDSISGVTMDFAPDTVGSGLQYHTLWFRADTLSDWSRFQPLAVGNVWKFDGRRPAFHYERMEVVAMETAGDTTVYSIESQREYLPEYGTGIVAATGRVYTLGSDRYRIRYLDGGGVSTLLMNLEPQASSSDPYTIEGIIPQADGTVDFSYFDMFGTSQSWRYGIGFDLETGDNIGNITRLIGYRVGDEEWGDIDVLVGIKDEPKLPDEFQLAVYPNPFNPVTTIRYTIPESSPVTVTIYDPLGREVKTLVNQSQSIGDYKIQWDGKDDFGHTLSSGIYFCRVRTGDFVRSVKLVFMK